MQPIRQTKGSIYVLKCISSKFYIGYTEKAVESRINEHYKGDGSEWTRLYKPLEVVETFSGDPFDEDATTKRYMSKYGIDHVRGGSYCQITIPNDKLKVLETEIRSGNQSCFICGDPGHYANKCTKKVQKTQKRNNSVSKSTIKQNEGIILCSRCGRNTHTEESCYAKTHLNGSLLPLMPQPLQSDTEIRESSVSDCTDAVECDATAKGCIDSAEIAPLCCDKCGRKKHAFGNICLYTTDVYSNPIGDSYVSKAYSFLNNIRKWF